MTHTEDSAAVLRSWEENAQPWTEAVRQQRIASRTLVTNQAIVDAVLRTQPASVLDLGCGEGWLSWRLAAEGIAVTGTDAITSLIAAAQKAPDNNATQSPRFLPLSYEDLPGSLSGQRFDTLVCNFSLLDKTGVEGLLTKAPGLLAKNGRLLIQTLHPQTLAEEQGAEDGWRHESWQGMGGAFRGSAPWYYRSLASWHALFARSGLLLLDTREPVHPQTGKPASIVFTLSVA